MIKYNPEVSAGHLVVGGSFLLPLVTAIIWGVAAWKDMQADITVNRERITKQIELDTKQDANAAAFRNEVLVELKALNEKTDRTNFELSNLRSDLSHMRGVLNGKGHTPPKR